MMLLAKKNDGTDTNKFYSQTNAGQNMSYSPHHRVQSQSKTLNINISPSGACNASGQERVRAQPRKFTTLLNVLQRNDSIPTQQAVDVPPAPTEVSPTLR